MENRKCLSCGKILKGRSDKKFCDDYCRNNYNNQLKGDNSKLIRNTNNTLRKNYTILQNLLPAGEETVKTNREKLVNLGFRFKYMTHQYQNKKGNIYFFCYDYGYLPLDNDWFLIVKRNEG